MSRQNQIRGNFLQSARRKNIETIRKWIEDDMIYHKKDEWSFEKYPEFAQVAIMQKSMSIIGCTRKKAAEYLDEIFGRFET